VTLPAGWDDAGIRAAAAAWVWVPPDATEARTEDYHLVAYPPSANIPTQVAWCRSERPAADLVDEIVDQVRRWGQADVSFWISQETRPPGLDDLLRSRGAEHVESVDVLALTLDAGVPAISSTFPGEVRFVDDEQSLLAAYAVEGEVWGQHPPTRAQLESRLAELLAPDSLELRAVALLDGEPVATGGATLADGGRILRLWGAATRAAFRGRGAYQALLSARLAAGRQRGAEIALVKAVTTTSSPILRHLGFGSYGQAHRLRLPL
jgi:hypothetical protein